MDFKTSFCWCSNLSNLRSEYEPIMFEARSENECGKWHFWVWNRVWIWSTGQPTPPKISQKHPPPPPGVVWYTRSTKRRQICLSHKQLSTKYIAPALFYIFKFACISILKVFISNHFSIFEETLIYSLVISFVKYYKLSFLRCRWKGYGSANEH